MEIVVEDDTKLTLHGLLQYVVDITDDGKNQKLVDLLDALEFNQVVIFVSKPRRALELNRLLESLNFPSIAIYGGLKQEERYWDSSFFLFLSFCFLPVPILKDIVCHSSFPPLSPPLLCSSAGLE